MDLIYFGNNLRLARRQVGFNQRQLAERTNTAQSIISDIELGKRKVWPQLAEKLSEVLKVKSTDLFPEGIANGRR